MSIAIEYKDKITPPTFITDDVTSHAQFTNRHSPSESIRICLFPEQQCYFYCHFFGLRGGGKRYSITLLVRVNFQPGVSNVKTQNKSLQRNSVKIIDTWL